MSTPRWLVAAAAGLAVLTIAAFAFLPDPGGSTEGDEVTFRGRAGPGGTIEELTLPALAGEGTVSYATYSDRPLVINFFASWCPSCIAEMPAFERVHAAADGEVAFLGVSESDARAASIELAGETGITYDTAFDREGRFFNAAGGLGMPTTIFVEPGGTVADVWVGALDESALAALVAEHFGVEVRSGASA